ncbi:BREX-1 system phosphatase PglZ type A [Candidatus Magnetaquicoccus inordinatus]|uniref:BREX-1 system phosphatase PglZ type A n=1 Tax=Candidatus Magnetaquicoccus inordinatus TaxID=2496818 RepID=UPI00102BB23F|nr:BREX-1 system phosphatase PglZ type A [Candidatus Magnetaquicoccus inordinatus]
MSSLENIQSTLTKLFKDGHRIVFWQDSDREFEEALHQLTLDGVSLIRLDQEPALLVKYRLEIEAPEQPFLLYQPGPPPPHEEDWFLDVRLYAAPFAADRATMHLRELGLHQQSLRDHLAERAIFLSNKDRMARLKKFIQPDDGEEAIDRSMMAVVTKADQTDLFNIIIALLQELDGDALEGIPTAWTEFGKFGLEQSFWKMVEERFGYSEESSSLRNLLIRLMVSDFAKSLHVPLPTSLRHLSLPERGAANSVVCLGQWRDSAKRSQRYEHLSSVVASIIKLDEHLPNLSIEDMADVKTFLEVEKNIASQLRTRILETKNIINLDEIRSIVSQRLDGYWASNQLSNTEHAPRIPMRRVYDALLYASELFDLKNNLQYDGLKAQGPKDYFDLYTQRLYRVDQLYRLFHEASTEAKKSGWDILKSLAPEVEALYGNWFIQTLSLNWGVVAEELVRDKWRILGINDSVSKQFEFYDKHVKFLLEKNDSRRVFVIISDALRYEAGKELADQLNGKYRFSARIESQVCVLPSYTALGMAALLPRKRLDYTDNGTVLVDGQSSSGLEQRSKILESFKGKAIKAETLMSMKQAEGREFIRDFRVVYVYHNVIDAIGDSASTEEDTFQAVRTTINDLSALISKIVNDFGGNNLLVTSDHGFLFQLDAPSEIDKNAITNKPPGTILSKKRYLLGRDLPQDPMVIKGSTNNTAGTTDGLDFWVPKGANRFHFVGGARFVHGGATLQEVVVPIIKIQQMKGKSSEATKIRTVGISVLGSPPFKITTNRHRFVFIQNEAVTERVKPLIARIAIYDGDSPITNVENITFDNQSKDLNEWKKDVRLTLSSRTYDKKSRYQLIVRNADTGVEELRMDVTIDMAFSNDF